MTTEDSNTEKVEYYGYFVTHAYMSAIQRGIQSAHVIQNMYKDIEGRSTQAKDIFKQWMTQDFTMIVLNGGNSKMIRESYEWAKDFDEEKLFPLARFLEDDQSMEGMMTAWGIVLPTTCKNTWDGNIEDMIESGLRGETFIPNSTLDQTIYHTVLANLKLA